MYANSFLHRFISRRKFSLGVVVIDLIHKSDFHEDNCSEKLADYMLDFRPDCLLECKMRSLMHSEQFTYIYVFKSIQLQSDASAVMLTEI